MINDINFLANNRLGYEFYDEIIEYELSSKISIYDKGYWNIKYIIGNCDFEDLKLFCSSLLQDFCILVFRILAINFEVEVYKLTNMSVKDRELKVATIIDGIQMKLSYGDKLIDFVTKKHFLFKREKLIRLFNKSLDQSIKSLSNNFILINEIVRSTKELQGLRKTIKSDEKSRTIQLASLIKKYIAKDESGYGVSETGKTIGEIDIKIMNDFGEVISLCEAFNLKNSFDKTSIKKHLAKLSGYNANGLDTIFVIVFSELKEFNKSWKKYVQYLPIVEIPNYKLLRTSEMDGISPARINICETVYRLNSKLVNVYHLYVDMN